MSGTDSVISHAHVWREGDRIRQANGAGYGDVVSNDAIKDHLLGAVVAENWHHVAFAAAVLDMRRSEASRKGS